MDPNVESLPKRAKTLTGWSAPKDCPCTAREAVAAAIVGPSVYLFGGLTTNEATGFEVVSDIFRYDTENGTMTCEATTGEAPLARTGHTFTGVGELCVLFGGLNHDRGYLNDTHIYRPHSKEWQKSETSG